MKPKIIYAVLGATATSFFFGWLISGLILSTYYKSQTIFYSGLEKDPPEMWAIIIMNLSWSVLLVYIFHVWAGIKTFIKGFTAGITVFFLVVLGFDISIYGFMNLWSFQSILVDIVANTFKGGLVGGVAGLILGIGEQKN